VLSASSRILQQNERRRSEFNACGQHNRQAIDFAWEFDPGVCIRSANMTESPILEATTPNGELLRIEVGESPGCDNIQKMNTFLSEITSL